MTLSSFLLIALATARVSCLIAGSEEGPASAFERARTWAQIAKQDTWWRRGLACTSCLSFWLGFVFAAPFATSVAEWIAASLAASMVTIAIVRKGFYGLR